MLFSFKMIDLSHPKLNLIDLNAKIQETHDFIHKDELHPFKNSVQSCVKSLCSYLLIINLEISDCAINSTEKESLKSKI